MTTISIIVPVYNVEQYLRKCVDSLLAQDYENYEIILIDDGSTDGSGVICDEYGQRVNSKEGRVNSIKAIHQKNSGLSAARNAGLKVAKGEYVCFVDSDDYWEENVLGMLMEQVDREQLDVLRFNYHNVRLVDGEYDAFEPYKQPHSVDTCRAVVDGEMYLNMRMNYTCYAVMYIMRREIVPLFAEGIHFEDVEWLPRMMVKAKRVASTEQIVYNYLIRQGSITQVQGNKEKIRKNIEDRMSLIERYNTYKLQSPDCTWIDRMQSIMVADVMTTVAREFYEEHKGYIRRLNALRVYPLTIADQGKTYARRARLINSLGASTYCVIMRLLALSKV